MRPRALRLSALLLVTIVLAGCSGLSAPDGDGGSVDGSVTPAPLPEDDGRLAPGVTRDGIVNESRLVSAHRAALEAGAYHATTRVELRHENGTVLSSFGSYRLADGDGEPRLAVRFGDGPLYPGYTARVATWSTESRDVIRWDYRNGTVDYEVTDPSLGDAGMGALRGGVLGRYDLRPTGVRTDNGTTTYLLTADDVDDVSVDTFGDVTRAGPGRLRVVITESGFVRRVALTVPVRVGDDDGTYAVTIRYDRTADPPERPDWVPRAINRTTGDDRPSDDERTSDDG
jgi:hypothetical protein